MNETTDINNLIFDPSGLKLLRERNKLTQEELANKVGKIGTRISEYENGVRSPNGTIALRLLLALDASPLELLQNSGRPELSPHTTA